MNRGVVMLRRMRNAGRGFGSLLLLAIVLSSACTLPSPLPTEEWDVPFDPLYRPTVWVETGDLRLGGGVVVASDPELGTYVLTAHHVVRDADRIAVGVFRHSLLDGKGPEYVRLPAELVAGGYLLDERIERPVRELTDSYRDLLAAAGAPGRFPGLEAQLVGFERAIRQIDLARDPSEFMAGLMRLQDGFLTIDRDEFSAEFLAAMALVSEKRSTAEGTRLGRRVSEAIEGVLAAVARFRETSAAGYDAALLRLESGIPIHSAGCRFGNAEELSGLPAKLVTIHPDRQPRIRPVRIGGDFRLPGSSELTGVLEQGNSGSPVFVDGRLIGIVIAGLYEVDEGPGDQFEEAVFLRILTVRNWLARRGLDKVLR